MKTLARIELLLAAVALVGCGVSWWAARSTATAAPVIPTEPSRSTLVYDPSLILLALVLATVAGVLGVLGWARLRRA